MKNTNWMKEMSWNEFNERRESCDTIILPAGSIEAYGPHMPLGTDSIIAAAICEMVAAKTNTIIGPMIEIGESGAMLPFPGTIQARPETYAAITRDILDSLIKCGFQNYLFINMNAGNLPIISQISREYLRAHSIRCAQIDWWRFAQPHARDICEQHGAMAHGHAGECSTSVMLYLHPEYVDQSQVTPPDPSAARLGRFPDVLTYHESFHHTPNGVFGDATLASAEKGRAIVERCVERIVEYICVEFGH